MVILADAYSSAWFRGEEDRGYVSGAGFPDKAFIKVIVEPFTYYFKFLRRQRSVLKVRGLLTWDYLNLIVPGAAGREFISKAGKEGVAEVIEL